jgi:hypothetical protein
MESGVAPLFAAKILRHTSSKLSLYPPTGGGGRGEGTKQQTPVTPLSLTGLCETERGRRDQDSKVSTKTLVCPSPIQVESLLFFLTSSRGNIYK